jgi:glutathione peroxidase-family protein
MSARDSRERSLSLLEEELIIQVELPKSSISLGDCKDKTLLFVNVASKCGEFSFSYPDSDEVGLTPQYTDLQALHEKYESKGLKVIGFPCNQVSYTPDRRCLNSGASLRYS